MSSFITFGNLSEGDYFFARGKIYYKKTLRLFEKPADLPSIVSNAFYNDGIVFQWSHFDTLTLVQPYDESIHGKHGSSLLPANE